jgi:hypothetical protein
MQETRLVQILLYTENKASYKKIQNLIVTNLTVINAVTNLPICYLAVINLRGVSTNKTIIYKT